jgi:hypothetical protein
MDDVAFAEYFAGLSVGMIFVVVVAVVIRNRWRARTQWRRGRGRFD